MSFWYHVHLCATSNLCREHFLAVLFPPSIKRCMNLSPVCFAGISWEGGRVPHPVTSQVPGRSPQSGRRSRVGSKPTGHRVCMCPNMSAFGHFELICMGFFCFFFTLLGPQRSSFCVLFCETSSHGAILLLCAHHVCCCCYDPFLTHTWSLLNYVDVNKGA